MKNNEAKVSIMNKIFFRMVRKVCSDEMFAKLLFKRSFNRSLNICSPKTFNEKIQWIKLRDRNPLYNVLADKFAVRKYVEDKIGAKYLNGLIGVYDSVDEIPIASLPNKFVLKATHGSGWNILCSDKASLDWDASEKIVKKWLKTNYFNLGREWAYKNIKPRIVCEEFLSDERGKIPFDYKIFCFNGVSKFIQVDIDRFENHTRVFYSKDWKKMPFGLMYPSSECDIEQPKRLSEMLSIAENLSEGISLCRVDLYSCPHIVFGEITIYPGNGFEKFSPEEFDEYWGEQIELKNTLC